MSPSSPEVTRRFQRKNERPRTAREITADIDTGRTIRLGASRYHDAVLQADREVADGD